MTREHDEIVAAFIAEELHNLLNDYLTFAVSNLNKEKEKQ